MRSAWPAPQYPFRCEHEPLAEPVPLKCNETVLRATGREPAARGEERGYRHLVEPYEENGNPHGNPLCETPNPLHSIHHIRSCSWKRAFCMRAALYYKSLGLLKTLLQIPHHSPARVRPRRGRQPEGAASRYCATPRCRAFCLQ